MMCLLDVAVCPGGCRRELRRIEVPYARSVAETACGVLDLTITLASALCGAAGRISERGRPWDVRGRIIDPAIAQSQDAMAERGVGVGVRDLHDRRPGP